MKEKGRERERERERGKDGSVRDGERGRQDEETWLHLLNCNRSKFEP